MRTFIAAVALVLTVGCAAEVAVVEEPETRHERNIRICFESGHDVMSFTHVTQLGKHFCDENDNGEYDQGVDTGWTE